MSDENQDHLTDDEFGVLAHAAEVAKNKEATVLEKTFAIELKDALKTISELRGELHEAQDDFQHQSGKLAEWRELFKAERQKVERLDAVLCDANKYYFELLEISGLERKQENCHVCDGAELCETHDFEVRLRAALSPQEVDNAKSQ